MDEQMPVMNGTQAVKKILEYEKNNKLIHTPVSALTANVLKGNKERGFSNGFDTFLGKPLVLKELEAVFSSYLPMRFENNQLLQHNNISNHDKKGIVGLDTQKLMKELMLNEEELIMLLTLFLKKMKGTLSDLEQAIQNKEYKKIGLLAHDIKGSSGNFRIDFLQKNANEMESMAKLENSTYNYEKVLESIKETICSIDIR
jgi:CheY-like chemotaxis protein